MPRFYSFFNLLVGSLLALLCGPSTASSQFENTPNIIRDLQRNQKVPLPGQPIQELPPPPGQPIPRIAPANQAQAAVLQPKSYSLRLFESEGQLQFHRFTTGVNLAQKPHELQLSDEQETRIVQHYIEQCQRLCASRLSACELDEHQLEKLQGAAVVDATRFIRNLRAKFAGSWEDQQARKLDPVNLRGELNEELSLGINNPNSLFRKIFLSVLTREQQVRLYRSEARTLLDTIDTMGNSSQEVSEGLLGIDVLNQDTQSKPFHRLSTAQRERLIGLIVDSNQDETDFWKLVTQPQTINLLGAVIREELAKFLTPPQVQAVLLQKAAIDKAHTLLQTR